MPREEAGAATVGFRGVGEKLIDFSRTCGRLRQMRRSARTGSLLDGRYELDCAVLAGGAP